MRGFVASLLAFAAFAALVAAPAARAEDPLPPPRPLPAPAMAAAAYRLASGDEIEIEVHLTGVAAADNPIPTPKKMLVASFGTVDLPKVRGLALAGRTASEVAQDVAAKLAQAGVSTSPEVYVRVTKYAQRWVYVVGAAFRRVEVSPFERTRLVAVLAEVGDVMRETDPHRVYVLAAAGGAREVDLTLLYGAGPQAGDVWLSPGDVVRLLERPKPIEPEIPRVWIFGHVRDPGPRRYYIGARQDQPMTLLRLIADASGPSEYGDLKRVTVRRFSEGGPLGTVRKVNVTQILQGGAADEVLQPNDVVFVDEGGLFK